jgi:hypothetical protein
MGVDPPSGTYQSIQSSGVAVLLLDNFNYRKKVLLVVVDDMPGID